MSLVQLTIGGGFAPICATQIKLQTAQKHCDPQSKTAEWRILLEVLMGPLAFLMAATWARPTGVRRIVKQIGIATLIFQLGPGAVHAQVEVDFVEVSGANQYHAQVYRAIWEEYGDLIVEALETETCMPFSESSVSAIVAEAVSHSGGPEHPMRLRASYIRAIKQSTLVHELGHRHLWQLAERLEDIDGHMTLYLILDRVWADIWGEEFANNRVRSESGWHGRYAAAWAWARSLSSEERARLWNELLAMNGFERCETLARPKLRKP